MTKGVKSQVSLYELSQDTRVLVPRKEVGSHTKGVVKESVMWAGLNSKETDAPQGEDRRYLYISRMGPRTRIASET